MSVDPRRTQPFCDPRCYRECRCSRWPEYKNRWGNYVVPHPEDGATYVDKVLSYNPIVYFPMNETAGLTAINYGTLGVAANGAYTGVTLNNAVGPDGVNGAPFFDGANDYLNFFSAAFDAAFNGATGSCMVWFQVANVGVWTDGIIRTPFAISDDVNNYYYVKRTLAANSINSRGMAGGGLCSQTQGGLADVDWVCWAITWSDGNNADQFIHYKDGAALAAACATMNNWGGGGLDATQVCFGAGTTGPIQVWHGWMAHGAVWDRVLTPAEIAILATPTP